MSILFSVKRDTKHKVEQLKNTIHAMKRVAVATMAVSSVVISHMIFCLHCFIVLLVNIFIIKQLE